jgi:hypothetical protein
MRPSQRRIWSLATIAFLAVVGVAAIASSMIVMQDKRGSTSAGHDRPAAGVQRFVSGQDSVRTSVVDDVTWTLTRSTTSSGTCLTVVASGHEVELGRIGGGCGVTEPGGWEWGLGGLRVANQWFNVAYGQAPSAAASVDLELGNGIVLADSRVAPAGGLWLFVFPADPISAASDVEEIRALDASGAVVASETPPSIVDYRMQIPGDPEES